MAYEAWAKRYDTFSRIAGAMELSARNSF